MFNPVGALLDLVFPPACRLCNELLDDHHSLVCHVCEHSFEAIEEPYCRRCGQPIETTCPDCRRTTPILDRIRSAFVFGGRIQDALQGLKFQGRRELAAYLAKHTHRVTHHAFYEDVDQLIPVPLHPSKLAQRGYNQSLLLARTLSEETKLPCLPRALTCVRATQPQSTRPSRLDRLINLNGAFKLGRSASIAGKNICLVDDVITTGATLSACAQTLLDKGARAVRAVTVARTLLGSP